jgi:glycosyltransferase involved in cell wall biosynthesis
MTAPETPEPIAPAGPVPLLTVIIPFKNEAPTLPLVLDSLARQETDFPFEVIFADGCSTDDSIEVIQRHPLNQRVPVSVVHLPPENHGMTVAKNFAAKGARGEFILFMQADVRLLDPKAFMKIRDALKAPGVVATTFIQLHADRVLRDYDFWGQVFQARYIGTRFERCFDTKCNAVRRDVFEKLGGFDEARFGLGGEDMDLWVRLRQEGTIADPPVEAEHLHGYGKTFAPWGMLKKYCRNAEVTGVTAHVYWPNRHLAPGFTKGLIQQLAVCAVAAATLIPWWWPWPLLLLLALGLWWNKAAFVHVRNWRLVWVPLFSLAALYCFSFYFLRGLIFKKTMFQFDNKMK